MRPFADLSIRAKLTWIAVLSSATALVSLSVILAVHESRAFRDGLVRRMRTHAEIIGFNSASALLFRDEQASKATLSALRSSPAIRGAAIYDESGRLFSTFIAADGGFAPLEKLPGSGSFERFDADGLLLGQDIVFEGKRVGTIVLRTDLRELREQLASFALILALVSAIALTVAFLISRRYLDAISRPIQSLAAAAQRVLSEKDYTVRAAGGGRDELGLLVQTFNDMLAEIQRRDAALEEARETLERRVEERTAELTALNREIESFSYSVSHDLRAPLRHIDGFVALLQKHSADVLDAKGSRYLGVIADGAKKMGRLIDDLLAFSRTSRIELLERRVELAPLVREVIQEVMGDAPGRRVDWSVGPLPAVIGDRSMLRIVFVNLLANAVKYTRGRETAHVEIGSRPDGNDRAVIYVKDDGVGFDMTYASKLFGVFQRLHRAEEFEGTGIGLATVQRIVHRHGGNAWAESTPKVGTTLFISLRTADEGGLG